MEDIISYLAEYFIPKIFELKLEYYKNPTSLADFAIATKEETDKLGREVLQAAIKEMDMLIKGLPARKRKWVTEIEILDIIAIKCQCSVGEFIAYEIE